MSQAVFEVDTFINVPPAFVLNFVSTLHNHKKIHALNIDIQLGKKTVRPDGINVDHWRITDRMKLGLFTIKFTYRVDMSTLPNGEVISDAYQSLNVHLHNVTQCLPEGTGTRLKEHVEVFAPAMLMKTTYENGFDAHKKMFANIKTLLESEYQ